MVFFGYKDDEGDITTLWDGHILRILFALLYVMMIMHGNRSDASDCLHKIQHYGHEDVEWKFIAYYFGSNNHMPG